LAITDSNEEKKVYRSKFENCISQQKTKREKVGGKVS